MEKKRLAMERTEIPLLTLRFQMGPPDEVNEPIRSTMFQAEEIHL